MAFDYVSGESTNSENEFWNLTLQAEKKVRQFLFEREIVIEEPEARWGLAPVGILDTFFERGASWGGLRPHTPVRKISTKLPAFGYKFVDISKSDDHTDLVSNKNIIENKYYRIKVDTTNGTIEAVSYTHLTLPTKA